MTDWNQYIRTTTTPASSHVSSTTLNPAVNSSKQTSAAGGDIFVSSYFDDDVQAFLNGLGASEPTTTPVYSTTPSTVSAGPPWVMTGAPGSTPFPTPINSAPIHPYDSASNYADSPASSYTSHESYGAPTNTLFAGYASAVSSTTDESGWSASTFGGSGATSSSSTGFSSVATPSTLRGAPTQTTRASGSRKSGGGTMWGGAPIDNIQTLARHLAGHINASEREIQRFLGNKKAVQQVSLEVAKRHKAVVQARKDARRARGKANEAQMKVEVATSTLAQYQQEYETKKETSETADERAKKQKEHLDEATERLANTRNTFRRTYKHSLFSHLVDA
ncbi:hypothetical protein Rhopal_000013-T1 [Rhodotorula paludigena]|uniref:BZIP domain-containing protein n=1 Tax=Rhodotorula paludigena TaxID=86838 RepID=A0AAV5G496_9BASI|nr:hypothetical protein Rhopal_000009-T1 [Rhodotorula paludigena]GJN87067.1 hypothetical protein Rhopal_000011-T1 [Rhodotorula paludigena]GJN87069.1 hypothetical protein Rhopal_000013-T1 [Rhodotorula paludigena]